MKNLLFSFIGIFFFLISCVGTNNTGSFEDLNPTPIPTPPPIIDRDEPKIPDPVKQEKCGRRGNSICEGDKKCEDACDDIFSSRGDKKDCYELPQELVYDFEALIEQTEDGDIEDINTETLECLLDIDERNFAKAVGEMSRREAQEAWFLITENEDLAEVLEDEDDEFNILEQLLDKATGSSSNLQKILTEEIDADRDDKTILWLAAESDSVWKWLDNFVSEECERSNDDCPGGDNIEAYCKALVELNDRDLNDFLSDADFFAEDFEDEVEDNDYTQEYDYEEDDFRDWCNNEILTGSSSTTTTSTCPTSNPPASKKLADFTLAERTVGPEDNRRTTFTYSKNHVRSNDRSFPDYGSSTQNSEDLFVTYIQGASIGFIQDKISYSSGRTNYYIYIDGVRYETDISDGSVYTSAGVNYITFLVDTVPTYTSSPVAIHAAYEDGNTCTYYYQ